MPSELPGAVVAPARRAVRRVRDRVRRFALARGLTPTPGVDLVRLGSDYGGWWVPATGIGAEAVVYSAGVGEDVSFDLALIARTGCHVWGIDPTPRAAAFAAGVAEPRFHFVPVGLWSRSEVQRFYVPRDATHVSHSIVNAQGTADFFEAQCRSLPDLMSDLGHERVDLLKMDIEGAEVAVLEALLESTVRPGVLCVELDAPEPARRTLERVRRLVAAGYVVRRLEGRNLTLTLGLP